MIKRGITFILCLALLAALAVPVWAEPGGGFLHPFTKVDGTTLLLTGAPAEVGTVSVTAGGQSVPCDVITVEEARLPITYYCIVDQSTSFSNLQKQQQLQALEALNNALRPEDSMVLYLMGQELTFGQPLTTPEARKQGIEEACVYTAAFTNLNNSIVSAVEQVSASRSDDGLSCILLITDGLDNANVPVRQEETFQTIASSGISFCTLSVVDPWADAFARNNASRMAEYARQSVGGVGVVPTQNYNSPTHVQDAVQEIVTHILSGSVLRLELSSLPVTGSDLELNVSCSKGGVQIADRCIVDAGLLPAPTTPTQPEITMPTQPETTAPAQPENTAPTQPMVTEASQPETAPTAQASQPETAPATETIAPVQPAATGNARANLILILVAAGFVLVLLLVILAVILWRRQRLEQPEEYPDTDEELPLPDFRKETDDMPNLSELERRLDFKHEFAASARIPEPDIPMEIPRNTPGCRVQLIPENHPEGALEFIIGVNESVTLGRNDRSDIVLNETDRALSGLHFELQWDSRVLYLRDRSSTNGTGLNGVPLRPEVWARVEKNAVIQAGSTQYAVRIGTK